MARDPPLPPTTVRLTRLLGPRLTLVLCPVDTTVGGQTRSRPRHPMTTSNEVVVEGRQRKTVSVGVDGEPKKGRTPHDSSSGEEGGQRPVSGTGVFWDKRVD